MEKIWRFLDSRFFVVIFLVAISPYWIAYIAQKTIKDSFPWLALGAASQIVNDTTGSGADEIKITKEEREEVLKNISLEFIKINPSEWRDKQEALFKLVNNTEYSLSTLKVNGIFFDEDGVLLDTDSATILSSEEFIPGSDQYFKLRYEYGRSVNGGRVNIGLATTAKAKVLDFIVVSKRN